jgi:uncharacterized protein
VIAEQPHLPRQALIDSHGDGGFRFAGMSHRGSLLCLPDGIWAWPAGSPAALSDAALLEEALAPAFERAGNLDFFLLGTGTAPWVTPKRLRERFRELHVSFDAMMTGPAVRTYNVMLMESRRVGAALIAE